MNKYIKIRRILIYDSCGTLLDDTAAFVINENYRDEPADDTDGAQDQQLSIEEDSDLE